jgi:hypothetical protein
MSSMEISNFTLKCGKNPAKTISFAAHNGTKCPFIAAGF